MNRYLTIHIPETAAPAPVSHFLRTQAGLTKKQISQAKFRPSGVQKNGQQCRVTETAYPGDQITVCLETDDVDSLHLESSSFTISSDSHSFPLSTDSGSYSDSTASEFAGSDANSHIYHSPSTTSQLLPELEILYEDQDILAVNKPAGLVTHPSGSHYSDSLSNQVAAYFRSKDEPTKVRPIGRLDKETSGILLFARNQTAAARLQKQRENGISEKTYLAAVSGSMLEDTDGTVDFGEGKKNIFALPDTKILIQKDQEVQMAVKTFGKGRGVYISGLPYSFKNSRILYRSVLWSAAAEDELHRWFSSNYNVEVHAYVKNGKYCVVNNTYEPQDTTVYTGDGKSFEIHLSANEIRWYQI